MRDTDKKAVIRMTDDGMRRKAWKITTKLLKLSCGASQCFFVMILFNHSHINCTKPRERIIKSRQKRIYVSDHKPQL